MNSFFESVFSKVTPTDLSILRFIRGHMRCGFLDWLMPIVTKLGDAGIIWIVIAVVFLFFKKTRRTGAAMGVAMLLGLAVGNGLLKNWIARPRPFDVIGRAVHPDQLLIDPPTDYSFPSGHTLSSFAAATAIYRDHTLLGFIAYVVAGFIAFSRMYLYVHYPTDILGGVVLGILLGLLGCKIVHTIADRFSPNRIKMPAPAEEK